VTFLDYMLWKNARHVQIYWVCTAHLALLKYTSMVRSCVGFEPLCVSQAIRAKGLLHMCPYFSYLFQFHAF